MRATRLIRGLVLLAAGCGSATSISEYEREQNRNSAVDVGRIAWDDTLSDDDEDGALAGNSDAPASAGER
jgi:hypothetical protein